MFKNLCSMVEVSEGKLGNILKEVTGCLESLQNEFQQFLPELTEEEANFVQNLFSVHLDITNIPDEVQGKFLDLHNDLSACDLFL